MALDDASLPGLERDFALVLHAWTMLRKEVGPVLGIATHLVEFGCLLCVYADFARGEDDAHSRFALIDDEWIFSVQEDPQSEDASGMSRDRAVSQIQAEEICVGMEDQAGNQVR
ncbi:MAG TPA: hypothetical protein VK471_13180 [Solirubrobacterales bacterium]|nr:hypothetical protein [Solirubrobacterales bacterium]